MLLRISKVSCRDIIHIFHLLSILLIHLKVEKEGNFLSLENYGYLCMEIRVSNTYQGDAHHRLQKKEGKKTALVQNSEQCRSQNWK